VVKRERKRNEVGKRATGVRKRNKERGVEWK
jgi:hypothetical protein